MRERMIAAGLWDAEDPRDPSESIEAAWQVVEKLEALGWTTTIDNADGGWETCLYKLLPGFCIREKSVTLSICRAALAAVETAK